MSDNESGNKLRSPNPYNAPDAYSTGRRRASSRFFQLYTGIACIVGSGGVLLATGFMTFLFLDRAESPYLKGWASGDQLLWCFLGFGFLLSIISAFIGDLRTRLLAAALVAVYVFVFLCLNDWIF